MSRTPRHLALLLTAFLCSAGIASAQVTTGTPPFGSFGGGPDVINLANLNAHLDISLANKPGRGSKFTYDLTYDSSVWSPVGSSGSQTWQPVANLGWNGVTQTVAGNLTYSETITVVCTNNGEGWQHTQSNFVYHDSFGEAHPFPGTTISLFGGGQCTCNSNCTTSLKATAADGSGYTLSATGECAPCTLTTTSGTILNPLVNLTGGSSTAIDRNGNEITADGNGHFYDSLSSATPVLTVSGAGTSTSPLMFAYTAPSGAHPFYKVNYTNYTVATNFNASGIHEYKSTAAVPLVSSIVLPDNSQYTFTYESTPGTCTPYAGTTCVTARIIKVTLPTGGTITYGYSGGNNGIFPDGSTATLTRTTPDGVWVYAQTKGTGAASATLITAPKLSYDSASNQTIAEFQGIYPTQTDTYQGTAPTFTTVPVAEATLQASNPLQEVQTCYNATATPCPSTAITLPITQRTVTASVKGPGKLWSQHTDKYNAFGLQTESDDYDFAAAPPGTRLQQTTITYAILGGSLTAFPQTVEVLNSAGTIQSRQDTAYDGAALTCITGAPQHDDTNYPCSGIARGNATSVTTYTNPSAPSGGIIKNFTYDSTGNLLTAQVNCCELKTWAYSTTTGYAYPDSVISGSSSPQLKTTATYDLNMGLVLTSTDPNNLKTTLTYDNMGRPLTSNTGTNPATTSTYTDSGSSWTALVCAPVQGTGTACRKTIMDSQGRVATSQLLDGSSNLYSATDTNYDAVGRPYKVSNPYTTSAAYWTQTNFDAIGRTVMTSLQDNSVSTSSYTDNTVTTTDPAGKEREGVSDALGRLTSVFEPADPLHNNNLTQQTSYTYNNFNQLTQVSQGSQTRTFVYDALARLNSSTTPEAGTVCLGTYSGSTCQANGYDNWNNLLYRTDARGVVTNYIYDTLNRLAGITYPTVPTGVTAMPNVCEANGAPSNNANVCFTFGTTATSYNNGLPLSMTDPSGSESYTYNSFEQIIQRQKVIGTTTYNTSYTFNLANELTQITYPSGRVVAQSFDVIGRLCAVGASGSTCTTGTTYASGFTYNAAQQPTAFNYGNTVATSIGYSADRLQPTSISYAKSGTTLFGSSYSYGTSGSNDGLISGITDNAQSGRSVSYTYDSLARLSTALTTGSTAYPQWGLSWTYDRYANRTAQTVTAGTGVPSNLVSVSATTNRLTGSTYAYDASGNMTNDGLNTLVYDGENRSTSATNSSSSGTYTYDGSGLRIKKIAGTTTTVYIFSGSKVVAEYDNGAAPTAPSREYIYSGTTILAKIDSTGTHYYHKDLASNRLVTDSSGNVSSQLGHYPYGESWYNASNDKLLFTTYERDAESGNDYAQARYYISRLGRFSSVDPLSGRTGDPQSLNRYVYARDLPILLVDPSGTCDQLIETRLRKRRAEMEQAGMGLFLAELEEMYLDPAQDDSPNPIDCFGPGGGGGGGGSSDPCPPNTICVTSTLCPPDTCVIVTPDPPPPDPCDILPSLCGFGPIGPPPIGPSGGGGGRGSKQPKVNAKILDLCTNSLYGIVSLGLVLSQEGNGTRGSAKNGSYSGFNPNALSPQTFGFFSVTNEANNGNFGGGGTQGYVTTDNPYTTFTSPFLVQPFLAATQINELGNALDLISGTQTAEQAVAQDNQPAQTPNPFLGNSNNPPGLALLNCLMKNGGFKP